MQGLFWRRHAIPNGTQHNDVVRCDLLRQRPHAPLPTIRGQVHWHLRTIIKNYRDVLATHAIIYRLFNKAKIFEKKKRIQELNRGLMNLCWRQVQGNYIAYFEVAQSLIVLIIVVKQYI